MKKLISTIIIFIGFISIGSEASDNFTINGYYKNFFMVYDFSDALESMWFSDDPVGIVTNRIRIDSKIKLEDNARLNISYSITPKIMDKTYSASQPGAYANFWRVYRFDDFDSRLYPKQSIYARPISFAIYHNLDRFYLSINTDAADIYIGRQPIAWGSARTVNPTDVITPYGFDELDSEERMGVDAIRFRAPIGFMGEFDAGYLFGEDFEFKYSAVYLRSKFYAARTDFSFLALGFKENLLIGFDLTRAIGGAGFWIEAAYVMPDALKENDKTDEDNYFRGTLGLDYSLTDRMYGFIEYHYNQPGENKAADYSLIPSGTAYFEGSVYLRGQHYLMPGASYQVTPLIIAANNLNWNLNDLSILIAPTLEYNIAENIYLSAGAFIGVGKAMTFPSYVIPSTIKYGSEFGGYADSYFTSFRFYF